VIEMDLSACRKGEISEQLFAVAAMVRDFEIFAPRGHSQTADFCIIKSGQSPLMVQVKTAYFDTARGEYAVNVARGRSSNTAYRQGDFDILAAYLPERNEFVFWTLEDLKGRKKVRYSPERHRKPSNWELLDDVAESLTFSRGGTANVPCPSSISPTS
jgi:hypothetical protein